MTVRLKLNHPSTVALAEVGNRLGSDPQRVAGLRSSRPVVEVQRADRPYATFYVSVTSDDDDAVATHRLSVAQHPAPAQHACRMCSASASKGARPQAMRIWLDAERLAAFGLSAADVQAALTRNNFLAAVGRTKSNQVQVDLLVNTDLRSVEEFERLIVREDGDRIVRISDIGRVELGAEEDTSNVRHNGKDAVYLSVWPLPGTNEISVAYALRAELDGITADAAGGHRNRARL